jgi:sugar phosphate isomerase/epimerase
MVIMKTPRSRRDFLKVSAAGALGAFLLSPNELRSGEVQRDPKTFNIGLQLYTIRDDMKKDARGSLKKVSDIGYKLLELADYENGRFYGYSPDEFRKIVNDLGMEVLSSHINVESTANKVENAQKVADDHLKLGAKYCVQPWIDEKERKTIAGYQRLVEQWNQAGRIMKSNGLIFGYHNHNFEFAEVEGKIPYFDVLLAELDKDLVTMEIDLFWATKAGHDPVQIFKKYPGRFQLFHMKDMYERKSPLFDNTKASDFAPVGEGVIDFKKILAAKDIAGMKYMIVEQDSTKDKKPFNAIKTSITNLTTKILV